MACSSFLSFYLLKFSFFLYQNTRIFFLSLSLSLCFLYLDLLFSFLISLKMNSQDVCAWTGNDDIIWSIWVIAFLAQFEFFFCYSSKKHLDNFLFPFLADLFYDDFNIFLCIFHHLWMLFKTLSDLDYLVYVYVTVSRAVLDSLLDFDLLTTNKIFPPSVTHKHPGCVLKVFHVS